jgi:hypothetical protein
MFKENFPMTPDDRGPVTFVDMVLVLLEDQFPWLATDSHDAISGADTVDQLIKCTYRCYDSPRHMEGTRLPPRLKGDRIMTSVLPQK